jgi:hypothetical protein
LTKSVDWALRISTLVGVLPQVQPANVGTLNSFLKICAYLI